MDTAVVEDTQKALQQMGARARLNAWGKDVSQVTGSAGKTTTKDVIATFLSVATWPVGKTCGYPQQPCRPAVDAVAPGERRCAAVVELG